MLGFKFGVKGLKVLSLACGWGAQEEGKPGNLSLMKVNDITSTS